MKVMVNNMLKKISILIVVSIALMTITVNANVTGIESNNAHEEKTIDSVVKLKSAIERAYNNDGKMTDSESKYLIESTSTEVLTDFFEEKMDDADSVIEKADIDVDAIMENGSNGYGMIKLDVGDHSEVMLEFEDKEETSISDVIKNAVITPSYAATNGETMWKSYGNRYFTAKKTVLSGIGGAIIKLENHYKVSSKGLDERYGDAYVSFNFSAGITGSISADSPIISDSSARTPGKSNINLYARYPYHYDGDGVAASGGNYKMSTAVDYLKKDATNKRIKVKHRWSVK